MTVLAREDILAYIDNGKLKVEPFVPANVGPCTIDLTLGNLFTIYEIDQIPSISLTGPKLDTPTKLVRRENEEIFTFHPHRLVLGMTAERIEIPSDLVGQVGGRSSIARLGTIVEMAARIDPGFRGNITLEIVNHGEIPISVHPGIKFCSLMLQQLSRPTTPYSGKYLDTNKPETTRIASELGQAVPQGQRSKSKG